VPWQRQRNRKLVAAKDQKRPRAELEAEGWAVPQDPRYGWPPLSVYDNSGSARHGRELRTKKS
jgi:hypothetical protein